VTELATQDAAGMSKQNFNRGETVYLVMTVRNRSNQSVEVQPPVSCADHEFMVAPMPSSAPLWRARPRAFTAREGRNQQEESKGRSGAGGVVRRAPGHSKA
jgi:hypothetical protein